MATEQALRNIIAEENIIRERETLRAAGYELAEAAINALKQYEGTPRLAQAVARWCQAAGQPR